MADHSAEYADRIQAGTVDQTMDELRMGAAWKPLESKNGLSVSGTVAMPLYRSDLYHNTQMAIRMAA